MTSDTEVAIGSVTPGDTVAVMDDDLNTRLKDRMPAPRRSALDCARSFLLYYVHDSDPELLERDLRGVMKVNATPIVEAIEAIEELIATPQAPGTIFAIVVHDGNQMLDTEPAAVSWLQALAIQLRRVLGAFAPPSHVGGPSAS